MHGFLGGGGGNRTRVQGFAGPCLSHSATPPERAIVAGPLPHPVRPSGATSGDTRGVTTTHEQLRGLLGGTGLDPDAAETVTLTGPAVALPSVFDVTEAATTAVAASTLAASLWRRCARSGGAGSPAAVEPVTVDRRHAALSFRAERHLTVDSGGPADLWDPLAGYYPTLDGGWVQLHTNFPHHRAAVLRVLGVDGDRAAVAGALAGWDAGELESAVAAAGGCAARLRTTEEWASEPAAMAVAAQPLVALEQIGAAPAEAAPAPGPVDGARNLRVLDLTRVVAGPVAGMTLADHGADVLHVLGPAMPTFDALHVGTGFAKREAHLDLRDPGDRARFLELVEGADVVLDAFRPGALADLGLGADDLVARRPGLVVVQLSAYGQTGPRARWRGFDSLAQTTSGICDEGRRAAGRDEPTPLPAQVLDYATGHLAAFAALAGVVRRHDEGGSWRARLSLARTAHWLLGLPRVPADAAVAEVDPSDLLEQTDSPFGALTSIRPPGAVGGEPVAHRGPPRPRGSDAPVWR